MFDTYAEIFRERAASYHHAMTMAPDARRSEFLSVIEQLDGLPPGLVCDIPAGGAYLKPFLRAGMRYVGVEPAKEFLADSSQQVDSLHADLTSIPLADRTVDYVVSLAGLHHEPNLAAVFGEMHRLLRPGGRLIVADVAENTAPARFLNGFVDQHNPLGHSGRFLDNQTAGLLTAAGFEIADDRQVSVPWFFADEISAGDFSRHLFGTMRLSPEKVAKALHEEIGLEEADGEIRLRWSLRRIVCDIPEEIRE